MVLVGPGGLDIVGEAVPATLKAAKDAPYAAPPSVTCTSLAIDVFRLDLELGPDADKPPEKRSMEDRATTLLTGVARSAIPHRDVVRFITGAGRQEHARHDATMAGWARRGYLKGLEAALGCPGVGPVALHATAAPTLAAAPTSLPAPELLRVAAPASASAPAR